MRTCGILPFNHNKHIFAITMPVVTKLGRMVTYHEGLPSIISHDLLITWSCEIIWQTKSIISPVPQYLWPQNLVGWWLTLRGSYRYSHLTFWLCGLAWSRDKLKPYLYYYNTMVTKLGKVVTYHEELPLTE